jgi:hypothetical protein
MINYNKFRTVCEECDGETIVMFEDIYGHQYQVRHCPFCGNPDILTQGEDDEDIPTVQ